MKLKVYVSQSIVTISDLVTAKKFVDVSQPSKFKLRLRVDVRQLVQCFLMISALLRLYRLQIINVKTVVNVTTGIHCCTAVSSNYAGKTIDIFIVIMSRRLSQNVVERGQSLTRFREICASEHEPSTLKWYDENKKRVQVSS